VPDEEDADGLLERGDSMSRSTRLRAGSHDSLTGGLRLCTSSHDLPANDPDLIRGRRSYDNRSCLVAPIGVRACEPPERIGPADQHPQRQCADDPPVQTTELDFHGPSSTAVAVATSICFQDPTPLKQA